MPNLNSYPSMTTADPESRFQYTRAWHSKTLTFSPKEGDAECTFCSRKYQIIHSYWSVHLVLSGWRCQLAHCCCGSDPIDLVVGCWFWIPYPRDWKKMLSSTQLSLSLSSWFLRLSYCYCVVVFWCVLKGAKWHRWKIVALMMSIVLGEWESPQRKSCNGPLKILEDYLDGGSLFMNLN